jgi:hypothetical protein
MDDFGDDREPCYFCRERGIESVMPDDGPCGECGLSMEAPAMKWARATADDDPDGFRGGR